MRATVMFVLLAAIAVLPAQAETVYVEVTGFVEHGEAIHHCQEADALVLALGSAAGVPAGWLPSKLFEYIAYQRPILANVGEGEARRLIREAGAGWTAASTPPRCKRAVSGSCTGPRPTSFATTF